MSIIKAALDFLTSARNAETSSSTVRIQKIVYSQELPIFILDYLDQFSIHHCNHVSALVFRLPRIVIGLKNACADSNQSEQTCCFF